MKTAVGGARLFYGRQPLALGYQRWLLEGQPPPLGTSARPPTSRKMSLHRRRGPMSLPPVSIQPAARQKAADAYVAMCAVMQTIWPTNAPRYRRISLRMW